MTDFTGGRDLFFQNPHRLVRIGGDMEQSKFLSVNAPVFTHDHGIQPVGEFPEPRIFFSLSPEDYFDLFTEPGVGFSIWETIYYQTVHSHGEILEWYRGSALRPYLAVLSCERKKEFEAVVLERIRANYPVQKDGSIIFRFPRLFFLLEKSGDL